jgi:hypothetical protein
VLPSLSNIILTLLPSVLGLAPDSLHWNSDPQNCSGLHSIDSCMLTNSSGVKCIVKPELTMGLRT